VVFVQWSEICIHTTHEAIEPISNILHESGSGGIVIEDPLELSKKRDSLFGEIYELDPDKYPQKGVFIKAYFPNDNALDEKTHHLSEKVNALKSLDIDIGENNITIKQVDEEDWSTAWKAYYKPIQISPTISIVPTWETYEPTSASERVIELDPGMAFGTGAHATTALCIQALEKYINKDDIVIDVGCGSGILSIAAALLDAQTVFAYDLDQVAVHSTEANVELNNLNHRIQAQQNDLLNGVSQQVHVIVANILAEVIVTCVQDAWHNLHDDGLFITSGIITRKKQMVIRTLEQHHFRILEVSEKDDWVCIIAQK